MNTKSIIAETKDLLTEEYSLKLATIFDTYERLKKKNSFLNKLKFNQHNKERPKDIPQYAIYFVKVLIDNIIYLFENKKNSDNNIFIHVVIGYLLKIVFSKFNFIPSHRLVIIIYQYLCNSLENIFIEMDLNDEIEKINKDFCLIYSSFEDEIINEKNKNIISVKQDFESNLSKFNRCYKKEECLHNPCFSFFFNFENMDTIKQYFFILILNYLKEIDSNEHINYYILLYYLNQNYFSHIEIDLTNRIIKQIENMDEIGVKNTDVLDLLKYSQKILEVNKIEDIKKISNELSSIKTAKPKVINCFDNTNEYYKDLLNELFYKIKKLEKIPQIIFNINRKNYWLSIIKLLSILLRPNHLEDSFVKMIFYFITKIFDKDLDFLEEKDFLSNNLYAMLDVIFQDEKQFLLFPEISYLLNDNLDIY